MILLALMSPVFFCSSTKTGYIQNNDVQIYYELAGTGTRTLVLIHGYGAQSAVWRRHVATLKDQYRVLTLDLRGHGKSSKPHSGYTLEAFADDIHAVLTSLKITDPIMVGWSLGGHIAQLYATRYPDMLSKLVLVCTSPCFVIRKGYPFGVPSETFQNAADQIRTAPEAHFKALASVNCNDSMDNTNKMRFVAMLKQNDPEVLALINEYFAHKAPPLLDNLSKITVPTLVIVGGLDTGVPPGASFYMHTHLPNATLSVFPSAGHSLPVSHREKFTTIIKQYAEDTPIQAY